MKKKVLCAIIAMGMLMMVGCKDSEQGGQETNAKHEVTENEKVDNLNEPKKDKESEESKKENDNKDTEKKDEPKKDEVVNGTIQKGEFAVYIANENIDGVKVGTTIKTTNLTIEENLKKIAEELENNNFKGCKIEVSKIVKEGNLKTVTINLKDGTKSWERDYLQGSTGGLITEETLIKSFLQRENKIEWIDAIKFTMNGKSNPELNHAPNLSQTINRNK